LLGRDSNEKEPNNIIVLLGAHNLHDTNEAGRRLFTVAATHIHYNWNPYPEKVNADIAILNLDSDVPFGRFIQPVCLPKIVSPLKNFNYGFFVGFGNYKYSLWKDRIPIRTTQDCIDEFPSLHELPGYKTFCGGFANETDSFTNKNGGGGLTVIQDGVHYLRGIFSASIREDRGTRSFPIFTDLRYFMTFIKNIEAGGIHIRSRYRTS